MKQKLFILFALLITTMTASAKQGYTLSVGTSEHGTVAFQNAAGEEITVAAEGETVTVIVTPDEGWATGKASGIWFAAEASAPQRRDIDLLSDFTPTKLLGNDNAFSFVMERANAEVSMTYRKLMTNTDITIGDIDPMGYTGEPLTPEVTVMDGETTLVLDQDYAVEYSDNVLVGDATITITGIGDNYAGVTTKTFEIYGYAIHIDPEIKHGNVTVQPFSVADADVPVFVTPEQGYKLKEVSVLAGTTKLKIDENLVFVMPPMAVTVTAEFELTPTNFIVNVEGTSINDAINEETDNMQKEVTGLTINLENGKTYTVSETISTPGDIIINGNGATIDASSTSNALIVLGVTNTETAARANAPEGPVEGYDYINNIIVRDVTIKGMKGSIIYDNKMKVCVENFAIENVVMDMETANVDYESIIAFEGGCMKDFTIKNSTFYGQNEIAKYFVRCSNGADFAKAGYGEATVTWENNTFYQLLKSDGQWGNNMRYNNNAAKMVLNFNKNIFVDCGNGQILRRLCNKDFTAFKEGSTMADNTFLVDGVAVDQGNYGNNSDLLYTPYFKDAANADFSVAKNTEQYDKETGDPRWITSAWDAGLHYITVVESENGSVIAPNTAMFEDHVVLYIKPAENYQLKSLEVLFGKSPLEYAEDYSFYMPSGDVTVKAMFEEIPTPTGIEAIDNGQLTMDNYAGAVYDLSGRQMVNGKLSNGKLAKGVYIINGKKLFVK